MRNTVVQCVGCLRYTPSTATLVKTYKDKGEQRLALAFASLMANAVPPSWKEDAECVTYVTATKSARRRRGFDHMELIARNLSSMLELPCLRLLEEPKSADQRALGRSGRKRNMEGRFRASCAPLPRSAILIDDVLTTGATMKGAASTLQALGCSCRCLVVARA